MPNKVVVIYSGGMDSFTVLHKAVQAGHDVYALSFNYGQRHQRELEAAALLARHFNFSEHHTINVNLAAWGGSSLTDLQQTIPSAGVLPGVIPNTYVPGRNTVFIAMALSLAEARGAERLGVGPRRTPK